MFLSTSLLIEDMGVIYIYILTPTPQPQDCRSYLLLKDFIKCNAKYIKISVIESVLLVLISQCQNIGRFTVNIIPIFISKFHPDK